jgi:hypothetical protein
MLQPEALPLCGAKDPTQLSCLMHYLDGCGKWALAELEQRHRDLDSGKSSIASFIFCVWVGGLGCELKALCLHRRDCTA